ncbi:hypothetical protein KR018_004419 [Drosophila ironensis]|nr:hypothetical protein KR018_004419 [Drosophila ironensis]
MSGATTNNVILHQHPHQHHGDHQSSAVTSAVANNSIMGLSIVPNGISVSQRDFYPSPPSTETESSGSVIQPPTRRALQVSDSTAIGPQQLQLSHYHHQQQQQAGDTSSSNNSQTGQITENGCYPEYKH